MFYSRHFSLRQVKLCIGQRKYKQKFTTQGRSDRSTSEWIRARSLNSYFAFCEITSINATKSALTRSGRGLWRLWQKRNKGQKAQRSRQQRLHTLPNDAVDEQLQRLRRVEGPLQHHREISGAARDACSLKLRLESTATPIPVGLVPDQPGIPSTSTTLQYTIPASSQTRFRKWPTVTPQRPHQDL